jgi:hypothetical protein
MERLVKLIELAPHGKAEIMLYMVDMIGLVTTVFWITGLKEGLSVYILAITAVSLTVTVAVKIYNLFNSNDNNKKV